MARIARTIFVNYQGSPEVRMRCLRRFVPNLTVYCTAPTGCANVEHVSASPERREYGAYIQAMKDNKLQPGEFIILMNDTVFKNRALWKISAVMEAARKTPLHLPMLIGFKESNFNVSSAQWFANPEWHIRTDVFALNAAGVELALSKISLPVIDRLSQQHEFTEIFDEFLSLYHPKKRGQDKDKATCFELYLTKIFFEYGFIRGCIAGRFRIAKQAALRFRHYRQMLYSAPKA